MSDFASLLGHLDQSAKRVSKEQDSINRRKRPRRDREEVASEIDNENDQSLPPDAGQLKIRLSFVCIGAQKAGTSWLHEMLCKIPSLSLPIQKELHFWDWHRRKGLGWYSSQFPSPVGKLCGEITPCYMALPKIDVQEIHKLFPDVRIIFLARDLIERAWSALTMELRNSAQGLPPGQFHGDRDVDALDPQTRNRIEKESDPDRQSDSYFLDRLKHSTHASRSDYAGGIRRWLNYFPKEQLLILNYKDVAADPAGLLTKILDHVQLKESTGENLLNKISMEELKQRVNTGQAKPIRPSLRKRMEDYLRPNTKEFNKLLQELGYDWRLDEY